MVDLLMFYSLVKSSKLMLKTIAEAKVDGKPNAFSFVADDKAEYKIPEIDFSYSAVTKSSQTK